jgi:ankyrin repeat protein
LRMLWIMQRGGVGSPLHWACKHGQRDLIELLVDKGASPHSKNFVSSGCFEY